MVRSSTVATSVPDGSTSMAMWSITLCHEFMHQGNNGTLPHTLDKENLMYPRHTSDNATRLRYMTKLDSIPQWNRVHKVNW